MSKSALESPFLDDWTRNAPTPASLASTYTTKSRSKSGKFKTGEAVESRLI